MFAANRAMVVGYREGPRKFVYWPGRDAAELYDLSKDPEERHNLVTPHAAREGKGRIAGWLLAQQRSFRAAEAEIDRRARPAAP